MNTRFSPLICRKNELNRRHFLSGINLGIVWLIIYTNITSDEVKNTQLFPAFEREASCRRERIPNSAKVSIKEEVTETVTQSYRSEQRCHTAMKSVKKATENN